MLTNIVQYIWNEDIKVRTFGTFQGLIDTWHIYYNKIQAADFKFTHLAQFGGLVSTLTHK